VNPSPSRPAIGIPASGPRLFWGTLFVAAVLLVFRRPDLFLNPQFWAEDGVIFFKQMHAEGWRSFFIPYQGYYHLLPRLIAAFTANFDPAFAPAIYCAFSLPLNLAVAAAVFSPRLDLPNRPLFALAVVLVPHSGEIWLNVTNLQWLLAPGILLLLFARDPETPLQWAFDLATLALLALTGPFVVMWLPFFVWRIWRRRGSRASQWMGAIAAFASVIQISAYLQFHNEAGAHGPLLLTQLARLSGLRLWSALLMPITWPSAVPTIIHFLIGLAGWGTAAFLVLRPPEKRDLRLILIFAGGIIMAAAFYKYRFELKQMSSIRAGDRYFYIPKLLIWWFFLFEVSSLVRWRRRLAITLLTVGLAAGATYYRAPRWIDYHWQNYVADIRAGREVIVPINPPGWQIHFKAREAE
jgi:hypothetical protein